MVRIGCGHGSSPEKAAEPEATLPTKNIHCVPSYTTRTPAYSRTDPRPLALSDTSDAAVTAEPIL